MIKYRLAVIPSIILLIFVISKNKGKRDPVKLLVLLALGGALSTIPSIMAETVGEMIVGILVPSYNVYFYAFVDYFLVVAVAEEAFKLIFLSIFSWKNRNFDHSYDGIIYGVCTALGFATLENILYVSEYGVGTAVLRAFSAVPLHCTCGVLMGYFYAKARECANNDDSSQCFTNMVFAYLAPVGLHGLYDFVVSVDVIALVGGLIVIALTIFLLIYIVITAAKNDHLITNEPLWKNPYQFARIPQPQNWQYNNYNVQQNYGAQQNYNAQSYGNMQQNQQNYGTQNFTTQSYGNMQQNQQNYGTQNYGSQSYGNVQQNQQNYGTQNYGSQSYGNVQQNQQNYGAQNYGSQSYGNMQQNQQNYGAQNFGTQSYGNMQQNQQNYGAQNFGTQSYGNMQQNQQNYGAQNYGAQSYGNAQQNSDYQGYRQ
jgi:RsiW-degrading membrane proteinase PrsW (M82 family)